MNEEIRKAIKRLSNKEYAARLQKYFKTGKGEYGEGDKFLGIRVPVIRKMAKKYRDISINEAAGFIQSPYHEERMFSLLVLIGLFKRANARDQKRAYSLYLSNTKYVNKWDLVDVSAGRIVGAYLLDRDKKPIYVLARSKNIWERRISIMSTSCFIGNNGFHDTLNIAEMLLDDREDLIHKAVGWLLRETGNRNIGLEEKFLRKHCKRMPRTMLRYAVEKFPEGKRKSYLKGELRNMR